MAEEEVPAGTQPESMPAFPHHGDDTKPPPEQRDPEAIRKQAKEIDDAHHSEASFHLSDESIKRAGATVPTIRPDVDEKGAHTGKLSLTPPAEVHG